MKVCPHLLSQGTCLTDDCVFSHDVQLCSTCRVVCISERALHAHLKGKKHRTRTRAQACPHPAFCKLCNVSLGSPWNYPQHIQGRAHRALIEEQEGSGGGTDSDNSTAEDALVRPGYVRCHVCDIELPQRFYSVHNTGIKHRNKERFASIQAAFDEADKDKHGVTVSHAGEDGIDFGLIETDSLSQQPVTTINTSILLTTPGRIDLSEVRLSSSLVRRKRPSNFLLEQLVLPKRLWFEKPLTLTITFAPRSLSGRFNDRLELVLLDTVLQTQFVITRAVKAVVGSRADWNLLKPVAPYKPKLRGKQEPEKEVVPGVKPPPLSAIKWVVPLPQVPIPTALEGLLGISQKNIILEALRKTWLPHQLDAASYRRHWDVLLWVEEMTMSIDIQRYDNEDVPMDPVLPFYRLPVPGLAEKRPSVIVGDRILVQNKDSKALGRWFEGYVHRVRLSDVDLKFQASFNSYKGQKFNIRFKLSRLPLRRMHQSLGTAFKSDRVLFPQEKHIRGRVVPTPMQMRAIRAVNRLIPENHPQLLAVTTILHMPKGSVPFVLFGPPGTGKTVTIVEAIRQILLADPNARVLACAPSNSAADLIAERLKDNLSPRQLLRLNAPTRNKEQLPKSLEQFSRSNKEGTFSVPPLQEIKEFRVIVSTCISASVPYGIGMQRGHFTHIFVDEAGQASEPEVMIPIMTMADNDTNIVLSGDPKQLGPIIRSTVAIELGLGMSYLDRLVACSVYDIKENSGICIVKLLKNWRSHPTILTYPNEQFYHNELEAHGDPVVVNSLLRCDEIITPGFPIVFHALAGEDMREENSPSFFNIHEASQVKRYVEALRTDQRLRLKDEHIGVIAPYHAQVMKIRTLLRKLYPGVKVGSVEEFQGQERRVIIISTVRSSIENVGYDVRHTLGFVANPRRFNVAITRAQALLLIIGDPTVLSLDPLWRGFMNYIYLRGGWKGIEPDWDPNEPIQVDGDYSAQRRISGESELEKLIQRTKEIILENSKRLGPHEGDEGEEIHTDRPWREAE